MRKDRKNSSKSHSNLAFLFIFFIGFLLLSYPILGQVMTFFQAQEQIATYEKEVKKLEPEEISKRLELAQAYNASLISLSDEKGLQDPFTKEEKEAGRAEYARMLEIHEQIGYIEIPRIHQELPIYAGTAEVVLQKGIGHLEGTSLPVGGENRHTVLTGHRGLPNARLFTDLDKVKVDDIVLLQVLDKTFAYQVDQILTVEPTDISHISIIPEGDYLTLITCTPYMVNTHRLLVRGVRVPFEEKEIQEKISEQQESRLHPLIYLSLVLIPVMLILFWIFGSRRKKRDRDEEE
ncbi:TPA: class C sortase [Streptococcus suis]|nr:class C sortase [Streptococcus suis]HEL2738652.1 class C sortase [Streptococcus suis]